MAWSEHRPLHSDEYSRDDDDGQHTSQGQGHQWPETGAPVQQNQRESDGKDVVDPNDSTGRGVQETPRREDVGTDANRWFDEWRKSNQDIDGDLDLTRDKLKTLEALFDVQRKFRFVGNPASVAQRQHDDDGDGPGGKNAGNKPTPYSHRST